MQRHRIAAAQLIAAAAMIAGTYAAILTTPAHTLTQQQRNGAALAVVLGALIIPAALTISAARESQP